MNFRNVNDDSSGMSSSQSLRSFFLTSDVVQEAHGTGEYCGLCRSADAVIPSDSSTSTVSPIAADDALNVMVAITAPPLDPPILLRETGGPAASVFQARLSCNGTIRADGHCYRFCAGSAKNISYIPGARSISPQSDGLSKAREGPRERPNNTERLKSHGTSCDRASRLDSSRPPPSIQIEFYYLKMRIWVSEEPDNRDDDHHHESCAKTGASAEKVFAGKQNELPLSEFNSVLKSLLFEQSCGAGESEPSSRSLKSAFETTVCMYRDSLTANDRRNQLAILRKFPAQVTGWDLPDIYPYDVDTIRRQRDVDAIAESFIASVACARQIASEPLVVLDSSYQVPCFQPDPDDHTRRLPGPAEEFTEYDSMFKVSFKLLSSLRSFSFFFSRFLSSPSALCHNPTSYSHMSACFAIDSMSSRPWNCRLATRGIALECRPNAHRTIAIYMLLFVQPHVHYGAVLQVENQTLWMNRRRNMACR